MKKAKGALAVIVGLVLPAIAMSIPADAHNAPPPPVRAGSAHAGGVRSGGFRPGGFHPGGVHAGAMARGGSVNLPHSPLFRPGGVYRQSAYRGTYIHGWRLWGGSFHYGPAGGVYLGFFDNPWFWGYPVYYYGYPVYPYAGPSNGAASAANTENADQPIACGSWKQSDQDQQFHWVAVPCPPPVSGLSQANPATPDSQPTGSAK